MPPLISKPKLDSITQPFGFKNHLKALRKPDYTLPFVLIMLVGLAFFFTGADFLLAPGLSIELPKLESNEAMSLPVTKVITLIDKHMLLFEGGIYTLEQLERQWAPSDIDKGRLLLKCDKAIDMESVLHLCELSRKAGFSSVQIAADKEETHLTHFIDI